MKHFYFFLLISASQVNAQDWSALSVPAPARSGSTWVLQENSSDDFNYNFEPTSLDADFGDNTDGSKKWNNFYHNVWSGPGPTEWKRDHVEVKEGSLQIWADRVPGETKKFDSSGIDYPVTRAGCITSLTKLYYPVFVEGRIRVLNSMLASDIWMLSPDDKEEIDIIECYGGTGNDGRNNFFSSRMHLSHHIFERSDPNNIQDYQPTDWNSWWQRGTPAQKWGGQWVRVGVNWIDETTIEYYIDGRLERILSDKAIATRQKDGTWQYTYPDGFNASTGKLSVNDSGTQKGYQKMKTAASLVDAQSASTTSVIDPYDYLKNGQKFSRALEIIINVEDQSWQAADGRSPNDAELSVREDNTMLVDWIRVYKPSTSVVADRVGNINWENKTAYVVTGETNPTVEINADVNIDLSYSTEVKSGKEEDLNYIATHLREVDASGTTVNTATFFSPVGDDALNTGTPTFSYKIPEYFDVEKTIPVLPSAELPAGHSYLLLVYMSTDNDPDAIVSGRFYDNNTEITLLAEDTLSTDIIIKEEAGNFIYPNPFSNEINIKKDSNDQWELFDFYGRLLLQGKENKVKGNDLSSGVYFLRVENKPVVKVIKN